MRRRPTRCPYPARKVKRRSVVRTPLVGMGRRLQGDEGRREGQYLRPAVGQRQDRRHLGDGDQCRQPWLAKGDLIMVIQMQGAEADFATVTDGTWQWRGQQLPQRWLYEIAGVAAVDNNTGVITPDGCGGLKNNHTATGHAQVVRVPQYTTLDVPTGTSITGDA